MTPEVMIIIRNEYQKSLTDLLVNTTKVMIGYITLVLGIFGGLLSHLDDKTLSRKGGVDYIQDHSLAAILKNEAPVVGVLVYIFMACVIISILIIAFIFVKIVVIKNLNNKRNMMFYHFISKPNNNFETAAAKIDLTTDSEIFNNLNIIVKCTHLVTILMISNVVIVVGFTLNFFKNSSDAIYLVVVILMTSFFIYKHNKNPYSTKDLNDVSNKN